MSNKILVVDDDPMMHMLYQAHFRQEMSSGKLIFVFKSNGPSALEYLQENQVDYLLADVNMPEMTGLELLEIVKAEYSSLNVIIISGFNKYKQEAEQKGALAFLQKPIKMEILKELISND